MTYSKRNPIGSNGDPNGHNDHNTPVVTTKSTFESTGNTMFVDDVVTVTRLMIRKIPNCVNVGICPEGANWYPRAAQDYGSQRDFRAVSLVFLATNSTLLGCLRPSRGKMWTYTTTFFRPTVPTEIPVANTRRSGARAGLVSSVSSASRVSAP
jgi:hypothetical protein